MNSPDFECGSDEPESEIFYDEENQPQFIDAGIAKILDKATLVAPDDGSGELLDAAEECIDTLLELQQNLMRKERRALCNHLYFSTVGVFEQLSRHGISLEEFEDAIGISRGAIAHYIHRIKNYTPEEFDTVRARTALEYLQSKNRIDREKLRVREQGLDKFLASLEEPGEELNNQDQ